VASAFRRKERLPHRGQVDLVQHPAREIVQLHRHHARARADPQRAEELKAVARRAITLHAGRDTGEFHLRAECPIQ